MIRINVPMVLTGSPIAAQFFTFKMRHFYLMVFHWSRHYGKYNGLHPRHYGNLKAEVHSVNHGALLSEPVWPFVFDATVWCQDKLDNQWPLLTQCLPSVQVCLHLF